MLNLNTNFENHLKNQSRILFSAPFGLGKTHFLEEFFGTSKDKQNHSAYKNNYKVFHLFPINYHVANNQDIVKLLKYDILKKMVEKKYFEIEIFEDNEFLKKFDNLNIKNGFKLIASLVISFVQERSKQEGLDLDKVMETYDHINKLENDLYKKQNDEKSKKAKNFISEIQNEWFAFDEDEFLTKFIREVLNQNKEKGKGKEFILIIDDLERLDPDHIFRILNIFSAFQDNHNENENLFGFNKIIIVTDIDNLQSIYHHKYGENTDFEGYIDKFYETEIFEFGNGLLNAQKTVFKEIENYNFKIFHVFELIIFKMIEYKLFTYRNYIKQIKYENGRILIDEKFENFAYDLKGEFILLEDKKIEDRNYQQKLGYIKKFINFYFTTEETLFKKIKKLVRQDNTKITENYYFSDYWNIFLHLLLIVYYRKNSLDLNMKSFSIPNRNPIVIYYDFEVGTASETILDQEKIINKGNREDAIKYFGDNIKSIHSFSDIWQLFLDYLEGENY